MVTAYDLSMHLYSWAMDQWIKTQTAEILHSGIRAQAAEILQPVIRTQTAEILHPLIIAQATEILHPLINLVPRAFSLAWGRGGKRPWHRLVTCPLYTLKSWV